MSSNRTRLEDLAEIAGVSIATVSRALNNSSAVNDETKRRVWKIAREQNYSFRPGMPALISGATATIALIIPTSPGRPTQALTPFFQELIGGISDAARSADCDVLISHLAPKSPDDLAHVMSSNRADGVFFLGQSLFHERFNKLAETETRFLVWGGQLPGQKYCSVGSDNLKGGMRATSHLLNLIIPARFEVESAEAALNALLSEGLDFDGVFGSSDLVALGAIRSLSQAGRQVPADVSVVGYDNIDLAAYSLPSLTTISQDLGKAGRVIVSKLLAASDGVAMQSERLPTELIVRESCGLG